MDLTQWTLGICSTAFFNVSLHQRLILVPLVEEFEACKGNPAGGARCLSYNPSPFGSTALVVGTKDPSHLRVWEYSEQYRRWQVGDS
jgi:hypothetical protein